MPVTSPHVVPHFSAHPMLPSFDGRPRSGISSTVFKDPGAARTALEEITARVRPGVMVLELVVDPVKAQGPSATLSGICGYRIISRGARSSKHVHAQVEALNEIVEQLYASDQQLFSA